MRLLLPLFYLLRVVLSNQQVVGFRTESVTLSPAKKIPNISSIKWQILSNDTWIATYEHDKTKTDHFWKYRGRLHLDTSSGNLTINNLMEADAMQYVVDVRSKDNKEDIHKMELRVAERLAPRATMLLSTLANGSCFAALQCSALGSAYVNFTWSVEPPATHWFVGGAFLFANMGPEREARFTCFATSALESATDTLALTCPKPCKTSNFLLGFLLGSCIILLPILTYIFRDKIEAAIKYLRDKLHVSNKHTSVMTDDDRN